MIFLHFLKCFPRQCGGQPIAQPYTPEVRVFPASAGVNPCSIEEKKFAVKRFPRRCGGQPYPVVHKT